MHFAHQTGLDSDLPTRRYLWTDAFAVCNFLGLARATGDARYQELALRLVDRVHHDLGRHRADDRGRTGWLSGLPDAEAEEHPTRGGLRIGKPLPERAATEPMDPDLEWDRDGQYFHYLTRWMHALDQVARATGQPKFNLWARELAQVAHRAFTHGPPGWMGMVWKLSIDLSRPLVPTMGQHDPLDGFVTCTQLETTATLLPRTTGPSLVEEAEDFARIIDRGALATSDPLGLGGLLVDANRLVQLGAEPLLTASLLAGARVGLRRYRAEPHLGQPADFRLAFRELGLSIGLAAVERMRDGENARRLDASGAASLTAIASHLSMRDEIESFWLLPAHRRTAPWLGHADINEVMLATSLVPEGFLVLATPAHSNATSTSAHI